MNSDFNEFLVTLQPLWRNPMYTIKREGVKIPCHRLFYLNIFKMTVPEVPFQLVKQPEVIGTRLIPTSIIPSTKRFYFCYERPGNKLCTNVTHIEIFMNNYVYSYHTNSKLNACYLYRHGMVVLQPALMYWRPPSSSCI